MPDSTGANSGKKWINELFSKSHAVIKIMSAHAKFDASEWWETINCIVVVFTAYLLSYWLWSVSVASIHSDKLGNQQINVQPFIKIL